MGYSINHNILGTLFSFLKTTISLVGFDKFYAPKVYYLTGLGGLTN
jgi:hypothetical protein